MEPKIRKTERMHDWRESRIYARYFVTICVSGRKRLLCSDGFVGVFRRELDALAVTGDIRPLEWTVMPDHLHLLFALGERLTVGQVVGRLKVRTRPVLETIGGSWQRDFYEHRIRLDDPAEPYAAYIFMNPYRARLIGPNVAWPYHGRGEVRWEFEDHLRPGGLPAHAWMPTVKRPAFWA